MLAATSLRAENLAPSAVTRESYRPAPTTSAIVALPQTETLDAPQGADAVKLTPSKIVIGGDRPELPEAEKAFRERLENKTVTVAELYAAARDFEQAYVKAGYVFFRVSVPPQRIEPRGAVRFVATDGFVEEIDVSAVPEPARRAVADRLADLKDKHGLGRGELERRVLIAGDVSGVTLHSTLARGKQPGGVKLILDGAFQRVAGLLTLDNSQSARLGGVVASANVSVNSLLGLGDQGYLTWSGSRDDPFATHPHMSVLGAGAVLPIGFDGVVFNPEITFSRTNPDAVAGAPLTEDTMHRYAARLSWSPVRSSTQTLALRGSLDVTDQATFAPELGYDLNHDSYAAARVGADYSTQAIEGQALSASFTLSQGLGGRNDNPSHQDAGPIFTKLGGTLTDAAKVGAFVVNANLAAQSSLGRALLTPENFALDGKSALSSFTAGALSVTEGASARLEIGYPVISTAGLHARPYVFTAGGFGVNRKFTAQEQALVQAAALGLGVETDLGSLAPGLPAMQATAEFSHYLTNLALTRHGDRLSLSLSARW